MPESPSCWINGKLVTRNEANVSVFDHGFLYGDGVFEGIRFFNNHPFMLHEHLVRLQKSAKAIGLELPYDNQAVLNAIELVINNFTEDSGYLRLIVTRGVGPLGLDPTGCTKPSLFIMADQLAIVSERTRSAGVKLIIASTRRLPNDGLDSRIKSLNYLNQILARMEANQAGADEAVLLNQAGRVAEGTTENLFIVVEGRLLTPPVTEGALDGITRKLVIQLAQQNGVSVTESPLTSYDLYNADECFLTGTGAELIPVREIDGRRVNACPGPIFQQLEGNYRKMIAVQDLY
ncbi:MAG: branched-chain-amino-acid transaminase [Candidatus Thiodiazotropha taylori]|nr:branched-chain-amino-acid transaminase [Candidatus Thiodiazotropha taylori]RLW57338.1 MAG: branched-chain-amino-acid transaminase [gamma proteobacterium symbiont of Stewartia floridana]RLW66785.1 MAG: branched-chain-amino-acid transaminase [gamma proteobacterium symbiont of Stewartia floridana]